MDKSILEGIGEKTDLDSPQPEECLVKMDPRPTLDVVNLRSPATLIKARKRAFKHALHSMEKDDKKRLSAVLSKYRRKQAKLLGHKDEDPDPYDSDYIFYCLEDSDSD